MLLNLRQIEFFRAVMIAKTVSGAAELLHVSQPGVSRVIKHMETKLGVELFERRKGRLVPTPEALALFDEIQSLYKHLENLNEATHRILSGEDTLFRFGASPSLSRSLIPSVLSRLREKLPATLIKFEVLSMDQVVDYLSFNQGECVVTIFPIDHPVIDSKPCMRGELVCVMQPDHPLAEKAVLEPADFAGEPLISFDPETPHGRIVASVYAEIGREPVISTYVRFAETACALVEAGLGIALVDEFTVMGNAFSKLVSRPLSTKRNFDVYLHVNNTLAPSAVSRIFAEELGRFETPPDVELRA